MNQYDLVVLTKTGAKEGLKLLKETLSKWQVKIKSEEELGVKTLAYPIKKQAKALYTKYQLEAPAELGAKLDRFFHLKQSKFLRYLLVRQEA